MSQENVEIVRASFEAWNAGDMDAFRELYDPDAILRMDANWPKPVDDRAAVRFIWRGVGQGPEAEVELTVVSTVRQGRIVAADYFRDYAEALETLGLRE